MSTTFNPYQAPKTAITDGEPAFDEIELATVFERVLARVIDYLLNTVVAITLFVTAVIVMIFSGGVGAAFLEGVLPDPANDPALLQFNLTNPFLWLSVVLTHAIFLALHGVLLHRYGQTIGKRLMKIAIVDAETHEVVPLPRLFVFRYLIWDFPALFFGLINWLIRIIDVCFGLRENRRTLHDMTANTVVIKVAHLPK